jgi:hypothetical protein
MKRHCSLLLHYTKEGIQKETNERKMEKDREGVGERGLACEFLQSYSANVLKC